MAADFGNFLINTSWVYGTLNTDGFILAFFNKIKFILHVGYQGALDDDKKRAYLMQFYKTVVDDLLPLHSPTDKNSTSTPPATSTHDDGDEFGGGIKHNFTTASCNPVPMTKDRIPHTIIETYTCTKVRGHYKNSLVGIGHFIYIHIIIEHCARSAL